jgi:thioredoxin-like negative regulator of GroEL
MSETTIGSDREGAARSGPPGLVFFYSARSGRSRRVEAYLSQVLQRRQNHNVFRIYRVEVSEQPELVERFQVEDVPTLVVFEKRKVRGRITAPRGCHDIEELLHPWLQ